MEKKNTTEKTPWHHLVATGALAGVVYIIWFIALLAVVLGGFNTRIISSTELLIVLIGLSIWFLFWGTLLGLIVGSGAALVSFIPRLGPLVSRLIWLFFFLLYWLQLTLMFRFNNYLLDAFSEPQSILVPILLIFVMLLGGVVLGLKSFHPIKRLTPALCLVLLLTSFIIAPLGLANREVEIVNPGNDARLEHFHRPVNYRIFLIGIDGMDWKFADALLAEDKMPNLKSLIDKGVRSPLATMMPTFSPLIWTTIATGKHGEDHRITGFVMSKIPFTDVYAENLKMPVKMFLSNTMNYVLSKIFNVQNLTLASFHRKEKALWNIFSDQGLSSGFINWWVTWPAESISGLIVSDRLFYEKITTKMEPLSFSKGLTQPPELIKDIESLIKTPEKTSEITYKRYMDISRAEIEEVRHYQEKQGAVPWQIEENSYTLEHRFAFSVSSDQTHKGISLHLFEKNPSISFWATYLISVDGLSHKAWNFSNRVKNPNVSQEKRKKYGRVVDQAYMDMDAFIGQVMEFAGEDAVFVVVSDHGFEKQDSLGYGEYGHSFAPPGVLAMAGPPIKKGVELDNPSVYDVAKNMLYLVGLPVADDMTGRVWTEAYTEDFKNANPLRTIRTYGHHTPVEYQESSSDVNDEIKAHLRALGYIQ